jgi:hypothetical protein
MAGQCVTFNGFLKSFREISQNFHECSFRGFGVFKKLIFIER